MSITKPTPAEQGERAAALDALVSLLMAVTREYERRHPEAPIDPDEPSDPARLARIRAYIIKGVKDRTLIPSLFAYLRGEDEEARQ